MPLITLFCCQKNDQLFTLLPPSDTGIEFQNTLVENDSLNILDYLYFYNGGGVAMGDINKDGLPDLFLTSNQNQNALYLNKGNLQFENITSAVGVAGNSSWNTGAVMADVNGDGWLDIYVIAVVGINGFEGRNELYINNQDNTFTEQAAAYGLDFKTYGTTANFFDFDLDGDLDLFLLNHAVHTEESFGRASLRNARNERTGDRLLRNDDGKFVDVSEEAGIFGGINGYGLGLTVSDFNQDGYPDMYVGNDFHEDDYFYLNNGDGTFSERMRDYFGHTTRFSMGNDAADINHDGLADLISLDMAPEDETVLKSSEGDDTYRTLKMRTQQFGYHYQFTRNMLFTANPDAPFTESALMSGMASTDWSWSALFADYDQDGHQDLFISNGIPKRPNDLDFIRFVSSEAIQKKMNENRLMDQEAMEMMPSGAVNNYAFQGDGLGNFSNQTEAWIPEDTGFSGATAIGDLDGDGDLDIVVNNINAPVGVYENTTNDTGPYLKLAFEYRDTNRFGVGTKAYAYQNGRLHYRELYPNRGWQASSDPVLHFGFESSAPVDSIQIIWPNQEAQWLRNVATNQTLTVTPEKTGPYQNNAAGSEQKFRKVAGNLGIDYTHKEDNHTDFDYQKLIPYELSDKGPALAVGDIDGDGKDDIFLGGARNQKASIYLQRTDGFERIEYPEVSNDSVFEDVAASIRKPSFGKEGILTVASGGNYISPTRKVLGNRKYVPASSNDGSSLGAEIFDISSVIAEADSLSGPFTQFVGGYSSPMDYGKLSPSVLHKTDGSKIQLDSLGMVTKAIWDDFDADGIKDLIVVGEWMSPKFFRNKNGILKEAAVLSNEVSGLWQTIIPFDIDEDGDTDYLLGNWGLNSKFSASAEFPMRMYYADFDQNSTTETVLAIEKNGQYYPLLGLNELAEQMVFLRKRFPSFKDFAGKTIEEIMGPEMLEKATVYKINTLASGFLRNSDNTFIFEEFPSELQTAPIKAFLKGEFSGNGKESVLAGGNYFGVIPFHGRFDSFSGALIHSDKHIELGNRLGLRLEHKSVRHLEIVRLEEKDYLLVVYNNEAAEIYEILD
ncbi:MAG: VCBS repeat-containing protein [Bacteroidota bacterium]